MKFYKLLNELTDTEVKKADKYANKRSLRLDFGPYFQKERTVIKSMKMDDDLIKRQYDLLLSDNKTAVHNMKDKIFKDLETKVKRNKKVKSVNAETNKVVLDDGRETKLTKFLNKTPITSDYFIVITHKPIDIVGMSTDKGWVSCTNIRQGSYKSLPFKEVQEGGMTAYLIQGKPSQMNKIMDDHKEGGLFQQKSISRIAIRRFEGMTTKKYMISKDEFIFKPEKTCYRAVGKSEYIEEKINFQKTVEDKLEASNLKTTSIAHHNYKFKGGNYSDTFSRGVRLSYANKNEFLKLSENEQIKILRKNPEMIKHLKNPTEKQMLTVLKKSVNNNFYLKDFDIPEKVKQYMMNNLPSSYVETFVKPRNIKLTDQDMKTMIDNSTYVISDLLRYNPKLSEDIKKYAIKHDPIVIRFIKHPSKELQALALSLDVETIADIKDEDLDPILKKKYQKEYNKDRNVKQVSKEIFDTLGI